MTSRPGPAPSVSPLVDTQTYAHLRTLLQQDSEASRLTERFARIAEIEGFPEAARAFREIGQAQAFQAQGHIDLLMRAQDPLSGHATGPTAQNLRAALAAHDELLDPLPEMVRAARSEGFHDVASWLETLLRARQAHRRRLTSLVNPGGKGSE